MQAATLESPRVTDEYGITVDLGTFKAWESEAGPEYSVELSGPIDNHWVRTYCALWMGSSFFSRFLLNLNRQLVIVTATESERAEDVLSLMDILDAMVRMTSRRATSTRPHPEPAEEERETADAVT